MRRPIVIRNMNVPSLQEANSRCRNGSLHEINFVLKIASLVQLFDKSFADKYMIG